MKRILCLFLTILLTASCLASCSTEQSVEDIIPYALLNQALKNTAKNFSVTVTTTKDGLSLDSVFNIMTTEMYSGASSIRIVYMVEDLNKIEIGQDGYFRFPTEQKTVYTGEVLIENGTVTQLNGTPINIPIPVIEIAGVSFDSDDLEEQVFEKDTFSAKISNPSAFFKTEISATDMKLSATLSGEKLSSIRISYTGEQDTSVVILFKPA